MRLRGLITALCGAGTASRRRRRRSRPSIRALHVAPANDARTAARARSATPASSRPSRSAAISYSRLSVVREHRRVVGVHRHRHAGVPERPDRVLLEAGHRAGGDVGRRADLERDAGLGEVGEQRGVLGRRGAVADPLGAAAGAATSQTVSGPVVSPACGTRVQPGGAGRVEVRLELRPRHADLRAAEPEADQPLGPVVDGVRRASRRRTGPRTRRGCRRSSAAPARSRARPRPGRPRSPRCRPRSACPRPGSSGRTEVYGVQVSSAYRSVLLGRHLAGDLVGQVVDVLGRADQVDDREVDLDEVREVAELVEPAQLVQVAGHGAGVPGGQLADDPRRRRADVVDVQLGLGQAGDEVSNGPATSAVMGSLDRRRPGSSAELVRSSRPSLNDLAVEQDRRRARDTPASSARLGGVGRPVDARRRSRSPSATLVLVGARPRRRARPGRRRSGTGPASLGWFANSRSWNSLATSAPDSSSTTATDRRRRARSSRRAALSRTNGPVLDLHLALVGQLRQLARGSPPRTRRRTGTGSPRRSTTSCGASAGPMVTPYSRCRPRRVAAARLRGVVAHRVDRRSPPPTMSTRATTTPTDRQRSGGAARGAAAPRARRRRARRGAAASPCCSWAWWTCRQTPVGASLGRGRGEVRGRVVRRGNSRLSRASRVRPSQTRHSESSEQPGVAGDLPRVLRRRRPGRTRRRRSSRSRC